MADSTFLVADKEAHNDCWIGMDVGTFSLSVELVDAVDAEQNLSGRVHGVIGDGEVTLQVRRSVRADELSVASLRRVIDENFHQSGTLRNRILGIMPRSPKAERLENSSTSATSAAENIISGFLLEWRRILRHAGHRTNPALPESSDLLELSAALESASPPNFVALRELDGKILACGRSEP